MWDTSSESTAGARREAAEARAGAEPSICWLQDPSRPRACDTLVGDMRADLGVVGGGYSGLWTALRAKERDPGRDVVVLEVLVVGWAASGRNGGKRNLWLRGLARAGLGFNS